MPKPNTKAIIAAAANSTLAKIRISIIARGVCSSHRMKAAAARPPTVSRRRIVSEVQPSRWPSAIPVINPSRAVHNSAKPSQSNGGISLGSGRLGMKNSPSTAAIAQNGSEM